jgi:hypothetical protein
LIEIRDNLADRIVEAQREGWLGEVEGLSISLAAAEEKIDQLDTQHEQWNSPVLMGIPSFDQIAARQSRYGALRRGGTSHRSKESPQRDDVVHSATSSYVAGPPILQWCPRLPEASFTSRRLVGWLIRIRLRSDAVLRLEHRQYIVHETSVGSLMSEPSNVCQM